MSVSSWKQFAQRHVGPLRMTIGFVLVALSACSIQLAPQYDQALLDGIQGVNKQIMELYASTSMGVTKESFPSRVDQYNRIIGTLDALALQSRSRPVPDSKAQEKIAAALQGLGKAGGPSAADMDAAMTRVAAECATTRKVKAIPVPVPAPAPSQNYVPASATALTQVSRGITFLRDTDCVNGLDNVRVALNRGFVTHFMAEAITYETYLQR